MAPRLGWNPPQVQRRGGCLAAIEPYFPTCETSSWTFAVPVLPTSLYRDHNNQTLRPRPLYHPPNVRHALRLPQNPHGFLHKVLGGFWSSPHPTWIRATVILTSTMWTPQIWPLLLLPTWIAVRPHHESADICTVCYPCKHWPILKRTRWKGIFEVEHRSGRVLHSRKSFGRRSVTSLGLTQHTQTTLASVLEFSPRNCSFRHIDSLGPGHEQQSTPLVFRPRLETSYPATLFKPPSFAIAVDCRWFASLSASVVAMSREERLIGRSNVVDRSRLSPIQTLQATNQLYDTAKIDHLYFRHSPSTARLLPIEVGVTIACPAIVRVVSIAHLISTVLPSASNTPRLHATRSSTHHHYREGRHTGCGCRPARPFPESLSGMLLAQS